MSQEFDYIQAKLHTQEEDQNPFVNSDPFSKSWDELKDLSGIDVNFKRRTSRNVTKYVSPSSSTNGYDPKYPAVNPGTVSRISPLVLLRTSIANRP